MNENNTKIAVLEKQILHCLFDHTELLDENLNNSKERYNNYKNLETKEK